MHIKHTEKSLVLNNETSSYIVNIKTNVDLNGKNLKEIPVQFGIVNGSFNCGNNQLKSLKGCPSIIKGHFDCGNNLLTSLNYFPKEIDGNVIIDRNKLKTLKGINKKINGHFDCRENQLTSLKEGPEFVKFNFSCANNKLKDLDGFPLKINGNNIILDNNDLRDLKNFQCESVAFFIHRIENKDFKISFLENDYKEDSTNPERKFLTMSVRDLQEIMEKQNFKKMLEKDLNKVDKTTKKIKI